MVGGDQDDGFIIAFWNAPDHMHGSTFRVLLQEQRTGPFRKIRILLDKNARSDTRHDLTSRQTIFRELIIAMFGNTNLALGDQALNFVLKGFQSLPRSSRLGRVTPLLKGQRHLAWLLRFCRVGPGNFPPSRSQNRT